MALNPEKLAIEILLAEEAAKIKSKPPPSVAESPFPEIFPELIDDSLELEPSPRPPELPDPRLDIPVGTPPVDGTAPPLVKEFSYAFTRSNYNLTGSLVLVNFYGEGKVEELVLRANSNDFALLVQVNDLEPIYSGTFDELEADSDSTPSIYAQKRPTGEFRYWVGLQPVKFTERLYILLGTGSNVIFERIRLKAEMKTYV